MADQAPTQPRRASIAGVVTNLLFFVLAIVLITTFGTILADRFAPGLITTSSIAPPTAPPAPLPTADTSAIDRLNAQIRALQTQLNAAQQPIVVQQVPPGDAPHPVEVQFAPVQSAPDAAPAAEPPAPMIINHVTSADGTRQTITGSGACAVAAKGARRCAEK